MSFYTYVLALSTYLNTSGYIFKSLSKISSPVGDKSGCTRLKCLILTFSQKHLHSAAALAGVGCLYECGIYDPAAAKPNL